MSLQIRNNFAHAILKFPWNYVNHVIFVPINISGWLFLWTLHYFKASPAFALQSFWLKVYIFVKLSTSTEGVQRESYRECSAPKNHPILSLSLNILYKNKIHFLRTLSQNKMVSHPSQDRIILVWSRTKYSHVDLFTKHNLWPNKVICL